MNITITFTANDVRELRYQMMEFIGFDAFKLPQPEPVIPEKAKTQHKKSKLSSVQEKPQEEELSPEPLSPEPSPEPMKVSEEVNDSLTTETSETPENLALFMKMKEEVIDALQAAFRAGKVQKVRAVLADYGDGAKSFREIDMKAFPAISKAIQEGALA